MPPDMPSLLDSPVEELSRREFMKLATVAAGVSFACSMVGCASSRALVAWEGSEPAASDPRLNAVALALLAPSPHNKQPWLVTFAGQDTLELSVDTKRTLALTDPLYRQIYIAQGAFLELLLIGVRNLGFHPELELLPKGEPSPTSLTSPAARIRLKERGAEPDEFAPYVRRRSSNKRPYNRDEVPTADVLSRFAAAQRGPEVDCQVTTDPTTVAAISGLAHRAVAIDMSDPGRYAEMVEMFRFNGEERERLRDGFGLGQSGIGGFKRWMAEAFFISREGARGVSSQFAKDGIDLARKQVDATPAWGWISTRGNSRAHQMLAGRAYTRGSLLAAGLHLAQHPMSQALQEVTGMSALREELRGRLRVPNEHTIQMLFRLGYADDVEHSPRRAARELIRGY
ncbi:MAG TPA: hypothetical protein VIV60_04535 [Polyangiaceae bacterium]